LTGENPIHDALAAAQREFGWFEDHLPGCHAAPEHPATAPDTMGAATAAAEPQEETVSVIDDLEGFINDVREIGPQAIADVKEIGAAAVADLKAVKANPETADVLADIGKLASLAPAVGIPAGVIAGVSGGLKTIISLYDTATAAPAQPDAPQQPAMPAEAQQPVPAGQ